MRPLQANAAAVEIKRRIDLRVTYWLEGRHRGLIDDALAESRTRGQSGSGEEAPDARDRRYNATVLAGKLRTAVRSITDRGGGGVLGPDDACTKEGRPVLDILQEKHPDARTPDLNEPENTVFEGYDRTPEVIPLVVTEDDARHLAARMHGSAGAGGL